MLSKSIRFNVGEKENETFFATAQKKFSKHLVLFYKKQPIKTTTQLSVIISKKVSNRAVVRNRLRRQIYAAVEKVPIFDETNSPLQIVLVGKRNCIKKPTTQEFQKEVQQLYDSL